MKCDICKEKVQTTFLNKVLGTYVKDKNNKRRLVCSECQSKLSQEEILDNLE